MAYDEGLAARIQECLAEVPGIREKKMFGGIAFLDGGHMFVGIIGDSLMVRIGAPADKAALRKPHVRAMDFTGKPMRGYVFVDAEGVENDKALQAWIDQARAFVATLPAKGASAPLKRKKRKA